MDCPKCKVKAVFTETVEHYEYICPKCNRGVDITTAIQATGAWDSYAGCYKSVPIYIPTVDTVLKDLSFRSVITTKGGFKWEQLPNNVFLDKQTAIYWYDKEPGEFTYEDALKHTSLLGPPPPTKNFRVYGYG